MAPRLTNTIHVRAFASTDHRPLAGLHVRAYDRDFVWDNCLGCGYTGVSGTCEILSEERPEICLAVYDDQRRELYRTGVVKLTPRQREVYITIPIDVRALNDAPRVTHASPSIVRPGTFVDVYGANFGHNYGDVTVHMGGREALVLRVTPTKLTVRIPPEPGSLDPLVISINGRTVMIPGVFTWGNPSRQGEIGSLGSPATYSGALFQQAGLGPIGLQQRVLIVMCYPSDKAPTDGGLSEADEQQRQIDTFEKLVNPAFRQMSFGATDFDFDYTTWLALPEIDNFYFWRQEDIDAAVDAKNNLPANATQQEIDDAQAAIDVATDKQAVIQESDELYHDGLKAAADAGWNLTDYSGIMLCLATDHLRGQSSGQHDSITDSDGDIVTLANNTNLWIISYDSHWGRRIHELAHAIASRDLYGDTGFISDAGPFDMMGRHNNMPLFSGYNIFDKLGWYGNANVRELAWSEALDHDETITLRAHDTTEDASASIYHVIKLEIFPGLTYYVEVRQEPASTPVDLDTSGDRLESLRPAAAAMDSNPAQTLFDRVLDFPVTDPGLKGGVLVTKVVDDTGPLNQKMRKITLLAPTLLQAGEEVVDATRRLTIRVDSKTVDRPLEYNVRVSWVNVATDDPAGLRNLRIRPWDANWQTNDIWIDSEANGWGTYDTQLEAVTGNPLGRGDKPWVGHWNRFYARIFNFGVVEVTDVQVTFYVNTPPGIGDNGSWVPHSIKTIPRIAAGSSEAIYVDWSPKVGEHTCLKVGIETQLGETDVNDNEAQENIFHFDTSGSSPHEPIFFEVSVQNPLSEWALIHMRPRGLRAGWESTVEHGWLWLPPLGKRTMRIALCTDIGRTTPITRTLQRYKRVPDVPSEITFWLQGGVYRWYGIGPNERGDAEHLAAIGGIQVNARARRAVRLSLDVNEDEAQRGAIVVRGGMDVQRAGVRITLELVRPNSQHYIERLVTDASGAFAYNSRQHKLDLAPGTYAVQAFIINDDVVADATSEKVSVTLGVGG
jgi:hypothetical protein